MVTRGLLYCLVLPDSRPRKSIPDVIMRLLRGAERMHLPDSCGPAALLSADSRAGCLSTRTRKQDWLRHMMLYSDKSLSLPSVFEQRAAIAARGGGEC